MPTIDSKLIFYQYYIELSYQYFTVTKAENVRMTINCQNSCTAN